MSEAVEKFLEKIGKDGGSEFDPVDSGMALLSGAASGLTFGAYDWTMDALDLDEDLAELRKKHPTAASIGDIIGTGASFVMPGGLGAKAASAGAKLGARAASGLGGGLAGRVAGGAVAGAVEGAAIGAGEVSKSIARAADIGIPGAIEAAGKAITEGAMWGAGLGVGGTFLKSGSDFLFGRMTKGSKGLHQKYQAEVNRINRQIELVESRSSTDISKLKKALKNTDDEFSKQRLQSLISKYENEAESVLRRLRKDRGAKYTRLSRNTDEAISTVMNNLSKGVVDIAATGAGIVGIGGAGPLAPFLLKHVFKEQYGQLVRATMSGLEKYKPIRKIINDSLKADKLVWSTNPILRPAMEMAARSTLQIPPIKYATSEQLHQMVQEVRAFDPVKMEFSIRMSVPPGIPPTVVDPLVEHNIRVYEYLKNISPEPPDVDGVVETIDEVSYSDEDRIRMSEAIRIAFSPWAAVDDYSKGRLSEESARSFHAMHPDVAKSVAEEVMVQAELYAIEGKTFDMDQKEQMALITGQFDRMGAIYEPDMIMHLQGNFDIDDASSEYKKSRISGLGSNMSTTTQAVLKRIG